MGSLKKSSHDIPWHSLQWRQEFLKERKPRPGSVVARPHVLAITTQTSLFWKTEVWNFLYSVNFIVPYKKDTQLRNAPKNTFCWKQHFNVWLIFQGGSECMYVWQTCVSWHAANLCIITFNRQFDYHKSLVSCRWGAHFGLIYIHNTTATNACCS